MDLRARIYQNNLLAIARQYPKFWTLGSTDSKAPEELEGALRDLEFLDSTDRDYVQLHLKNLRLAKSASDSRTLR